MARGYLPDASWFEKQSRIMALDCVVNGSALLGEAMIRVGRLKQRWRAGDAGATSPCEAEKPE